MSDVSQQFAQGNVDFTDSNLDLAISGQGFFILSDNGALAYSRAGAFQIDRDGYVVNSQQQRLQVYPPLGTPAASTPARLTTCACRRPTQRRRGDREVEFVLNLPANATAAAGHAVRCRTIRTLQPRDVADVVRLARRRAHRHDVLHQDRQREPVERAPVHRRHRRRRARRRCSIRTPALLTAPVGGKIRVPGLHADHRRGRR